MDILIVILIILLFIVLLLCILLGLIFSGYRIIKNAFTGILRFLNVF